MEKLAAPGMRGDPCLGRTLPTRLVFQPREDMNNAIKSMILLVTK